jgi:GntR family transcriptional regulator/MocR family aminotransferase
MPQVDAAAVPYAVGVDLFPSPRQAAAQGHAESTMPRRPTQPLWNVLALDRTSATSLQDQIVAFFRDAVLRGALKPGTRVPSSRQLAAELGVARITAVEAFDRLAAEGYFVTRRGVGLFVADTVTDAYLSGLPARPAARGRKAATPTATRAPAKSASLARPRSREDPTPSDSLPLATGVPALEEFPWRDWARISARVFRERPAAALAYGDPQGLPELRVAIADYLGAARGIVCDPDQIVVVSGSQQGIDLTARVVAAPGDAAWFEEPGYGAARTALTAARLRVVLVPADRDGIDVAHGIAHAPDARLAMVTPSYHYPLGGTLSLPRRRALLAWAHATGAWILEDDYYGEYRFAGRPQLPLYALDRHARVLYLGTFSKMLAPGLRIGFLVAPRELVTRLTELKTATDRYTPGLMQLVLARFIAEGRLAAHVRRMRTLYRERRAALLDALATHAADVLDVGEPPDAGLHVAVRLKVDVDDVAVSPEVRKAAISAAPLSAYYARPPGVRGFVLGFADTASIEMNHAVAGLVAALRIGRPRRRSTL